MDSISSTIFVLVLTFTLGSSACAADPPLKHVLIINSYHDGYKGSDDLVHGIQESLRGSKIPLEVKVEYLDSKFFSGTAHDQWVLETLKRKYAKHDYELLITTDDYAFDVVEMHRDSTFGRIPVVFSGTNYFDSSRIRNKQDFIGVDESPSFADTIDLILRLHPATQNMVAIHDDRITGQLNAKAFLQAAKQFSQRVKISALSGLSMDELLAAVKAFKPGTIAVYFASQVDGGAEGVVSSSAALERLAAIAPVPIYGGWEFNLGHGIVGGKLVNLYEHGLLAGKLGAGVLTGGRSQSNPQVLPSPNRYMFDHNQLLRFGISESALPVDSVIINKPPQFIRAYTNEIVAVLIFLLAVSVAVSIRGLMLRRREFQTLAANLKAALDAAPVPMAINDSQKNITYVNDAFVKTYGYSKADIPRLEAWWTMACPDLTYREWVSKEWGARAEKSQRTVQPFEPMEISLCCKDGSRRTVLAGFAPILSSRWAEAIVTLYDITERKRNEEALRLSEERLRTIVETEPECVKVVDRDGRLTEMNAAGLAMLEADSLADAQQRSLSEYLNPEYRAAFMALHKRVMCGESGVLAFEIAGLKGTRRWLETHAAPMRDAAGDIIALLGITRDITERKSTEAERIRLEAQLRESQKMEALGTLAGGVAHDFNNALAAILGNVQLARQDVGTVHPALVSLNEIEKASRRARDLVQQILAFGRRQTIDRKVTSLSLVVLESARLIRATLPADVTLNVECKPNAPAVLADATQVKQILLNLCQNAQHAVQGQGRPGVIWICLVGVSQVEPSDTLRPGRYACLSVRDNGSGMDEASSSHIFEPFFTTKPKGQGTGLGLSVVHGIAQTHDATIGLESEPGKGSEFRIYFPACELPVMEDANSAKGTIATQGNGKHVLYVDDEEAIIFLMTRLLERKGYRVSGFTDPKVALAAARADPRQYDIAVTDYSMPGMSGLEVAVELRKIRADLPVVLASGYITEELRQKAPAAGVRELIYKPDTVEALCDAVAHFANE